MKRFFEGKKKILALTALCLFCLLFIGCKNLDAKIFNTNGRFVLLGKTIDSRAGSTATLLNNGKVLITGGYPAITSTELYDPATRKFTKASDLNVGRYGHSAILLNDGRVLIVGGYVKAYTKQGKYIGNDATKIAEIYNPVSGKFTTVEMAYPFDDNNLTLLQDGRVLVSWRGKEVQIFNPETNEFKMTSSCLTSGCPDNTIALSNGKVLLASGNFPDSQPQLFNPKTESFEFTGKMSFNRTSSTATLLKNGEVIIIGGRNNYNEIAQAEIYNPATGKFRLAGKLNQRRYRHSAILLSDGRVLVVGGYFGHSNTLRDLKSAEIYDYQKDKFIRIDDMHYARISPTLTKLNDGKILIMEDHRPELFINK